MDYPQTIETFVMTKAAPCEHERATDTVIEKKASFTKDGKKKILCSCGEIIQPLKIQKAKQVILSKTRVAYTGKTIHKEKLPKITIKDSKGKTISSKYYTVEMPKSVKAIGRYACKVTFKKSCTEYSGSKTVYFEVVQTIKTKFKKVTPGKNSITIKWIAAKKEKKSQVTGYNIRVSTDKSFKKKVKDITIKGYKKNQVKVGKLQPNKRYYVQIRTYKLSNGKKIYSNWSSTKVCMTKKG